MNLSKLSFSRPGYVKGDRIIMEEKKTKKKGISAEQIKIAYREYVLIEGKQPTSPFQLSRNAGFSEQDFFSHFSSLPQVEAGIWLDHLGVVFNMLHSNKDYATFTGRDKCLLFYFTMLQQLKTDRSFILWSAAGWSRPGCRSAAKKAVAEKVKVFFTEITEQAIGNGEVKDRLKLSRHYSDGLMLPFWFILDFWIRDESRDFEDSDALVEKTIALSFDLLGESPLEKAIDLGRFLLGRFSPISV
jgi:hypothetical protein